MKNAVRVIALSLVVVMACLFLASCGLSGKYEATIAGTGVSLEFKGSKVYIQYKILGATSDEKYEAKYKIDGDKITITVENKDDKSQSLDGTFDFKKNDDGSITIGGVTYKKV
ncbi:MAG: hypothetical protein J6023_07855 [Clostridia bacterium]|nr:hypothetical protein [Clostridia bacterium]